MITKWEDIPGVEKVYYGGMSDGVVLVFKDDFAVVSAALGYEDEAYPTLAKVDNEDALWDAIRAGADGAQELYDAAKAKFARDLKNRELQRLAYLQEKYGGVTCQQ